MKQGDKAEDFQVGGHSDVFLFANLVLNCELPRRCHLNEIDVVSLSFRSTERIDDALNVLVGQRHDALVGYGRIPSLYGAQDASVSADSGRR